MAVPCPHCGAPLYGKPTRCSKCKGAVSAQPPKYPSPRRWIGGRLNWTFLTVLFFTVLGVCLWALDRLELRRVDAIPAQFLGKWRNSDGRFPAKEFTLTSYGRDDCPRAALIRVNRFGETRKLVVDCEIEKSYPAVSTLYFLREGDRLFSQEHFLLPAPDGDEADRYFDIGYFSRITGQVHDAEH